MSELLDGLGRPIHDLRISVTDRCNFRCTYCMPREVFDKHKFLPRQELLSFEEIERLVRLFASQGVRKIRLTGGEPLVRNDLETLVESLASIDGIDDVAMTSNVSLMTAQRAQSLRDAGLSRINVSLDALDDATFKAINDVDVSVQQVLDGINYCADAQFDEIKINMVVKKGLNEHSILPMAEYFKGSGHILRFIEFMDVGNANGWVPEEVFTASEIVEMINTKMPIAPTDPNYSGEVAKRWSYVDGGGEVRVIASLLADHDAQVKVFKAASDALRERSAEDFKAMFAWLGEIDKHLDPIRQADKQ
eukprot:maker-scaffold8110_size2858-snap-gene-0.3 protein:Tk11190 transcript:maker-scaffold8110_size2858-snap-gene-0.3-mRNA-1 annotation:"molybdenum cofactor biosynthesis protein"